MRLATSRTVFSAALTRPKLRRNLATNSTTSIMGGVGPTITAIQELLIELQKLDTPCLCDADKSLLQSAPPSSTAPASQVVGDKNNIPQYVGLRLMNQSIRPINFGNQKHVVMAGVARTVQCTEPNDFLAVLRGLEEAQSGEVLVVDTLSSNRAVAGELFGSEAVRKGVTGIVVDGPMRDTAQLEENTSVRCYSTSVTPYSGTVQSVGKMQEAIHCAGVMVSPGDIIVGDNDGIVVGNFDTFQALLPIAKAVQETEARLRQGISKGTRLVEMTTFEDHLKRRLAGEESSLEFRT